MNFEQEPLGDEQNEEFILDEKLIRTGQPNEAMSVTSDSGMTYQEAKYWATYGGVVYGHKNISGYGNSEEEAIANLKERIASMVERRKSDSE